MDLRSRLPAFVLFAIILSGGSGITRMIFFPHDLIGLSAIIVALALVAAYKPLATSKLRIAMGNPRSKWPIRLASVASDSFPIFPGRPEGYVGYTDYTAMNVDVNDDLATRVPAQQYALLGFGSGFLEEVQNRLANITASQPTHFCVIDASLKSKETIGWLAYLQKSGTDNARPSTENLRSVIQAVSAGVRSNGPITMNFWDKVNNRKSESLAKSDTSITILEEFIEIYEIAFVEGQQKARSSTAIIKKV